MAVPRLAAANTMIRLPLLDNHQFRELSAPPTCPTFRTKKDTHVDGEFQQKMVDG